jgi:hypothetical protein
MPPANAQQPLFSPHSENRLALGEAGTVPQPSVIARTIGHITLKSNLIDNAYDDLAHGLRVLLEADFRANRDGLLFTDRAEAVGNIETAFGAALNAFHSLYDSIEKQLGAPLIDWYGTGELAVLLALRNARHHNHANKIRTLYTFHAREAMRPDRMSQYILIDFPSPEEGADTFDLFLSWADFRSLLSMPSNQSRIRPSCRDVICSYLKTDKFASYAAHYGLSADKIFFNVVPLIVNGAIVITPLIKPYLTGLSLESRTYSDLFDGMPPADTKTPQVNCGPFVLPS